MAVVRPNEFSRNPRGSGAALISRGAGVVGHYTGRKAAGQWTMPVTVDGEVQDVRRARDASTAERR